MYFAEHSKEFAASADVKLKVEGKELPAHAAVLRLHSKVLDSLLASIDSKGRIELPLPSPATYKQAVDLLCFMYSRKPTMDKTVTSWEAARNVAHLSHQLDCPAAHAAADCFLSRTLVVLTDLEIASFAEKCRLPKLLAKCIPQAAMSGMACARPLHEYFSAWALNQMFSHVVSNLEQLAVKPQMVKVCQSCGLLDRLPTDLCQSQLAQKHVNIRVSDAVKRWTEDEKHALHGKCRSYLEGAPLG